jgi:hypothetical protein
MFALLHSLGMFVVDLFKSRRRLEAENLFLRHQLSIALRRAPPRLRLRGSDRALLVCMTRLWPSLLGAVQVVQPETILRWHRAGFTAFWRWKSRKRAARPKIEGACVATTDSSSEGAKAEQAEKERLRAGTLALALREFEPMPWPVSLVYAGQGLLPLKLRAFLDFAAPRLKARLAQSEE